jgi:hypothetical protein
MQPVWLVSGEGYAYLRFGPSQGNFEQARVRNHEREREEGRGRVGNVKEKVH